MVAEMTDYTATAKREGRWWVVQCVEEPNAITQVARLNQVDEYLRESLAFVTGTTEEAIGAIRVIPEVPNIGQQLDNLRRLQRGTASLEHTARALNRSVAATLAGAGLTVRDVGAVLGVSYQRAHQIIADAQTTQPVDAAAVDAWTAAIDSLDADPTAHPAAASR